MEKEKLDELHRIFSKSNNRYEAFYAKVDMFYQNVQGINDTESLNYIKNALKTISSKTVKSTITTNCELTRTKYLNVSLEDKEDFVDNILNDVRSAIEILAEKQLTVERRRLEKEYIDNNIKDIDKKARDKYYNAVRLLMILATMNKTKLIESELFEIKKDMYGCIDYYRNAVELKEKYTKGE